MTNIYSIYDKKSNTFAVPTFALTDGVMIRDFRVFLRQKNMFSDYPEDYDLYRLGSFDEETGMIVPESRDFVISFVDILKLDEEVSSDVDKISEES